MPAAKKAVTRFDGAPPAEIFDTASRSDAQYSNLGPAGLLSLAFSEVAQYEMVTHPNHAASSSRLGMGQVRVWDPSGLPSDEVRGEVQRMFESEITLPDPLNDARFQSSGLQSRGLQSSGLESGGLKSGRMR